MQGMTAASRRIDAPKGSTRSDISLPRRILATVALAAVASLTLGATNLGDGDAAVIGASSASPAVLVRGGSATFSVEVTANEGNISNAQCVDGNNKITTGDTYTVGTALSVGGTAVERLLNCAGGRNFTHNPETLQFSPLTVVAAATAPLGNSNHEITFGAAGSAFVLGQQVQTGGTPTWVNPRLYVTVNPRPASDLSATAGVEQVTLAWTHSPDNADITDYRITAVDGSNTRTLTAAKTQTSLVDSGLTAGTEYCYTIRARYNDGTTDFFSTGNGPACATPTAPATSLTGTFGQPIDQPTPGNYVINKGKVGRVIPVKLEVWNGSTEVENGATPSIRASQVACSTNWASDTVESYAAGSSSVGFDFRWDASAGHWIYNLDTSKLPGATANKCYRIDADVNASSIGYFVIQLVK